MVWRTIIDLVNVNGFVHSKIPKMLLELFLCYKMKDKWILCYLSVEYQGFEKQNKKCYSNNTKTKQRKKFEKKRWRKTLRKQRNKRTDISQIHIIQHNYNKIKIYSHEQILFI